MYCYLCLLNIRYVGLFLLPKYIAQLCQKEGRDNTYKLQNKVKNSHRAIDDVMALFEVFKALNDEKSNLLSYVNKFSFNPKYGIKGQRISKVKYFPQS